MTSELKRDANRKHVIWRVALVSDNARVKPISGRSVEVSPRIAAVLLNVSLPAGQSYHLHFAIPPSNNPKYLSVKAMVVSSALHGNTAEYYTELKFVDPSPEFLNGLGRYL